MATRLTLITQWPRLDKGGLEAIVDWCGSVPEPRLIVIDTLQKVKPIKPNSGYAEDYDALQALQQLAGERGIAILILHHQRKMEAADPLDTVSGTLGLAGSADTILVLDRTPQGITLHGRGRDIETLERAMQFDTGSCRWRLLGDAEEVQRSTTIAKILEALAEDKKPMTPKEIVEATGLKSNVIKQRLRGMLKNGEAVKVGRGSYAHRDYVPPITIVTTVTERGLQQPNGYDSYEGYGPRTQRKRGEEAPPMSTNLYLIKRVQARLGSLRLYEHPRLGPAEVVEVRDGEHQVLELRRHENEMLPSLLAYVDEVQRGVDADRVEQPKPAKRARKRRTALGDSFKRRTAGGGA